MPSGQELERAAPELAPRLVPIGTALERHAVRRAATRHSFDVVEHRLHRWISVLGIFSDGGQDEGVDALIQLIDEPGGGRRHARQLMGQ
jgi:hypothetical protein